MSYSDGKHINRYDMTLRGHMAAGKTPDEIRAIQRITVLVRHNTRVADMRLRMFKLDEVKHD